MQSTMMVTIYAATETLLKLGCNMLHCRADEELLSVNFVYIVTFWAQHGKLWARHGELAMLRVTYTTGAPHG